jgi:two-component system, OmpR family, phosphate regulon sensor histidine kinase PhoR
MYLEPWLLFVLLFLFIGISMLVVIKFYHKKAGRQEDERETLEKSGELDGFGNVKKDFVANVSHELRTPVAIIMGFAETLHEDYDQLSGKQRREFIGKIKKNSQRLRDLVEDLLDLSQLESPEPELRLTSEIVEDLVGRVTNRFLDKLDSDTQDIRLELTEEVTEIRLDVRQIESSLENLIDNAIRYATGFSVITIRSFLDGNRDKLLFEIEDDGCGIPEKDLPRIFERFYRVDKGRSRESGGTGLGLSIVRNAISLHGGEVKVRSEVSKGTTFSFSLSRRL